MYRQAAPFSRGTRVAQRVEFLVQVDTDGADGFPEDAWIGEMHTTLPELPKARRARYARDLGLKTEVARVLVADRSAAAMFEESVGLGAEPGAAANWITQDLAGLVHEAGEGKVTARHVVDLVAAVAWPYKLHIWLGLLIFFVFPFSRLVHVWSAPVGYVFRKPQVVRRRGAVAAARAK